MGVEEEEPERKRNKEMKPSLKVKGRNYGHLHPDITTVIVTILESFPKKDQEDLKQNGHMEQIQRRNNSKIDYPFNYIKD